MLGKGYFSVARACVVRLHHKGKERRSWCCSWRNSCSNIQKGFLTLLQILIEGIKETVRGEVRPKRCLWQEQFVSWTAHANSRDLSPRAEVTVVEHPMFHGKDTLAAISLSIPSGAAAGSPSPKLWVIQRNGLADKIPPHPHWTQTSETPNLNPHLLSSFLSQS